MTEMGPLVFVPKVEPRQNTGPWGWVEEAGSGEPRCVPVWVLQQQGPSQAAAALGQREPGVAVPQHRARVCSSG